MNIGELAKIISSKKIKLLPTMIGLRAGSILKQLHQLIINDKADTDEELAALLYKKENHPRAKYNKLKYNYKQRLYHTVLLAEPNDKAKTGERKKAFFHCARAWLIGYFLILIQARKSGIAYLEHSIDDMLKYEFTVLILESCKILRQHYGVMASNSGRHHKYNQLIQDFLPTYVAETKAEGYYHELMSYYVKGKQSKTFIHEIASQYHTDLSTVKTNRQTSSLIYKASMIEIIKHLSVYEYQQVVEICERTATRLKQKSFVDNTGLATIYYQWIISCSQLKQYEQAKSLAEQVVQYTVEGSFNWFKGMEVLTQLSFSLNDYQGAYDYFSKVTTHKNYKTLSASVREEWTIYKAYLSFLVAAGQLADQAKLLSSIKIAKFINEVPISSKDKDGKNIPVLICSLVSLLQLEQYDRLIDRAEKYKKYIARYLKHEEHLRTHEFIKMLLAIPNTDLTRVQIECATRNSMKTLLAHPIDTFNVNYVSEVIPYEQLWQIVLDLVSPFGQQ